MAPKAPPSLGATLEALPMGVALVLLAALPSFFNLATDQIFEEQKSLLLRAGALIALPGAVVMMRDAEMRRLVSRPVVVLFFGLVVMLALSATLAGTRDAMFGAYLRRHGLATWLALASLFVGLLAVARASSGRGVLLQALLVGTVWPAIYLLLQRGGVDVLQWIAPNQGHQPGSTFGNHVLIGGYLALAIPVTVAYAWRVHWAWAGLAVIQVAALVTSGSRGAGVALTAAAAVGAWHLAPRRVAVVASRVVLAGLVLLFLVPSLRPAAVMERLNPAVGSARVRILIWQGTAAIVSQSGVRWWIGHGPESLRSLFVAHYSPEIGRLEQIDAMPDRAHNEVLDMMVSGGAVGTVLELALFGAILLAASREADVALRAGLSAAVVAHVIEIQFGIASVTSRFALLAIAATVTARQIEPQQRPSNHRVRTAWIAAAASLGALSPWLSTLPSLLNNPIASGTEVQFVEYLTRLSLATPLLYGVFLAVAFGLARSAAANRGSSRAWWQLPAVALAGWLVIPISLGPSRADAYSAAGRAYALDGRWPEATIAFGAAARDAAAVPDYWDEVGRTSIEWAIRSEAPRRDQLLAQAHSAYERAIDLDRSDPRYQRHLASYYRIRASWSEGGLRDEALAAADRIYARLSTAAPTLTPVWIEWAWVEVDRQRPVEAIQKLDQALMLDPQRADAQRLRADLLAGRVPMDAR